MTSETGHVRGKDWWRRSVRSVFRRMAVRRAMAQVYVGRKKPGSVNSRRSFAGRNHEIHAGRW